MVVPNAGGNEARGPHSSRSPTVQLVALLALHNDDFGYETNCFVCEQRNERGLRIPFFHDDERRVVTAEFTLSNTFSGAPTLVHGGVSLAVLDEAMAWACIAVGRQWAVTRETTTRFDRAVYVDKPHRVEAELVDQSDTEIVATARIVDLKGRVRAESRATFTVLGDAQLRRAAGETGDTIDPSMHLD